MLTTGLLVAALTGSSKADDLGAWPADLYSSKSLNPGSMIVMPSSIEMLSSCQDLLRDHLGVAEAGHYVFVVSAPDDSNSLWIMRSRYLSAQRAEIFDGEWVFAYICAQHRGQFSLGVPNGDRGEIDWLSDSQ